MTPLRQHLASGATTVCRAWLLTRTDGVVMGFTDHDRDLIVDGIPCTASSGLSGGALEASTGLAVDNVEASGALTHGAIREEDIRAGRWDSASVVIWLVNWAVPEDCEIIFAGTVGEITWGGGAFAAELRGSAEALNRPTGRVFQSRCDAILGDARCGLKMGPAHVHEVSVKDVEDDRILFLPPLSRFARGWFERGTVTILDGPAAGLVERIKADRVDGPDRRIELWSSLLAPLAAGDRVRIEAGCDKRRSTCRDKFANLLNFRGFPDIPGEDWLMAYPSKSRRNDGGRG
jgi:uncharacterized phage protein (TIGR02218 family)